MKRMIITSLVLCALGASSIWAMEEKEPERRSVKITVCNAVEDDVDFECSIGICALKTENINGKLLRYFGIDSQKENYMLKEKYSNEFELKLSEQEYNRLFTIKDNGISQLMNDLREKKQSSDEINGLLARRAGWTNTKFGKHSLENAITRFFNENIGSCEMDRVLFGLDSITRVIQDNKYIDSDNKKVWQEIIDTANILFQDRISFNLLDEKLLAEDTGEAEESWIVNHVDLQGMQFLAYALKHMHAKPEEKSRIIGSWFEEKIGSLKPEQLELITKRVQLWLGHYKQVETHFADMCTQKQEIAASMVRNALLKKAGLAALVIGVGFAAYQLYQHMCNTPVDEQPENVQA